jgi:hypothetical protein
MRSLPVDSIDILGRSMFSTDTTAGLAEMLNLGLSSSLYKYNEQKMTEYQKQWDDEKPSGYRYPERYNREL